MQIEQIIVNVWAAIGLAIFIWQIKAIKWATKSMLSEVGGGGISHKRCIAIASTMLLLYLCYYVVKYYPKDRNIDPNILVALVTVILTSAAIASVAQVLQLIIILKGGTLPKQDATQNQQQ